MAPARDLPPVPHSRSRRVELLADKIAVLVPAHSKATHTLLPGPFRPKLRRRFIERHAMARADRLR
jgi:hypothetical protein